MGPLKQLAGAIVFIFVIIFSPAITNAEVSRTVNFDFDSAQLDQQARDSLAALADEIRSSSPLSTVVVIGHTDAVGSSGYNQSLGLRRARAVAAEMVANGIAVSQIGTVASRGKSELLVRVSTPERANRRVNVSLSDLLQACRSYREVMLPEIDPDVLSSDLRNRLERAVQRRAELMQSGTNSPAYQVAGAAVEDCSAAYGFAPGAERREEYVKRCLCNYARISMLGG